MSIGDICIILSSIITIILVITYSIKIANKYKNIEFIFTSLINQEYLLKNFIYNSNYLLSTIGNIFIGKIALTNTIKYMIEKVEANDYLDIMQVKIKFLQEMKTELQQINIQIKKYLNNIDIEDSIITQIADNIQSLLQELSFLSENSSVDKINAIYNKTITVLQMLNSNNFVN